MGLGSAFLHCSWLLNLRYHDSAFSRQVEKLVGRLKDTIKQSTSAIDSPTRIVSRRPAGDQGKDCHCLAVGNLQERCLAAIRGQGFCGPDTSHDSCPCCCGLSVVKDCFGTVLAKVCIPCLVISCICAVLHHRPMSESRTPVITGSNAGYNHS